MFPSSTESIIWKAASLLTTAIPLVALAATGTTTRLINHRIDTLLLALKYEFGDSSRSLAAESDRKEACVQRGPETSYKEIKQLMVQDGFLDIYRMELETLGSLEGFLQSMQHLFGSESAHYRYEGFFHCCSGAADTTEGVPLRVPEATELSGENRVCLQDDIRTMTNLIKTPEKLDRTKKMVEAFDRQKDIICDYTMIITGIVYFIARFLILSLALAALRKQDERLYISTWTKYLPNISQAIPQQYLVPDTAVEACRECNKRTEEVDAP